VKRAIDIPLFTELSPGTDLTPWQAADLTWAVTCFRTALTEADVRAVINEGRRRAYRPTSRRDSSRSRRRAAGS
jgi:hypothetical protein